jgi:Flp pilus assembly protein protease CpaA
MPPLTPQEATVALGLLFACYTDIRWWKIPNAITGLLILAGLVTNTIDGEPMLALIGFAVAFAIHYPLWMLGVQKGGDAKLMLGIGALVGWPDMVETTFWKFLLFIPVGLGILAATGNLKNLAAVAQHTAAKSQGKKIEGEPPKLTYTPYAPIIAVGWFCAFLTDALDFF